MRDYLKDEFLFVLPDDLAQARLLVDQAVHLYNEERPHLALNYLTPNQVHQQAKSPAGKSERGPALFLSTNSRTRQCQYDKYYLGSAILKMRNGWRGWPTPLFQLAVL